MAGEDGKKGDNPDSEKEGLRISDAVKKIFTAGVSAAFMTEESVRAYLSELKLPKEIVGVLLQSATKTKDEIALRVTNEVLGIIRKIDFVSEISRFAEDHKFRISAEVEIVKKDTHSPKKSDSK
jgi:hypothetical protein